MLLRRNSSNSGSSKLLSNLLRQERSALLLVFSERKYAILFSILAIGISALYMYLLPSLPEGVLISQYAIRFITPTQEAFAVAFGFLFGLVIVLNLYAFKMRASSSKGLTLASILASFVNALCCTPLIPSIIALSGVSTQLMFELSPRIQAFFESTYLYFYLLSAFLLLVSIHLISKNISSCCHTVSRGEKRL